MRLARRIFQWAGIYGVVILVPQYFLESRIATDFPPAINHPEFYYGFLGVALAWQILFFVIASDPRRFRPVMIPAVLEKLSFGFAAVVLFLQGRIANAILMAGIMDLVLALLFFYAYRQARD
jgi:hypothetical protein